MDVSMDIFMIYLGKYYAIFMVIICRYVHAYVYGCIHEDIHGYVHRIFPLNLSMDTSMDIHLPDIVAYRLEIWDSEAHMIGNLIYRLEEQLRINFVLYRIALVCTEVQNKFSVELN